MPQTGCFFHNYCVEYGRWF